MHIGRSIIMTLGLLTILFTGCDKDDPIIPNEEELITTLVYTLIPVGGGPEAVMRFIDLDGDGGDEPIVTTQALAANTTYDASILLLDETVDPAELIHNEVIEEGLEHQLFFSSTLSGVDMVYGDQDEEGRPIGILSQLITGESGTGTLTITLRHKSDKMEAGVQQGDITNAGGETDIEVTFPLDVL